MDDWSKFGRSFNSPLCKDYVVRNLTVEEIAKKHESFLGMSCQDVEEWVNNPRTS